MRRIAKCALPLALTLTPCLAPPARADTLHRDCSSFGIATADAGAGTGQYPSLTINGNGRGLISYYDANNGDLKVAHCGNAACTP